MLADVDVPADEEIQRRIAVRMKRQKRLTGDDAPKMWVVLNEAALHGRVGGRETMREQLRHLAEMSRPNRVVVQVLTYGAGAHPGDQSTASTGITCPPAGRSDVRTPGSPDVP